MFECLGSSSLSDSDQAEAQARFATSRVKLGIFTDRGASNELAHCFSIRSSAPHREEEFSHIHSSNGARRGAVAHLNSKAERQNL